MPNPPAPSPLGATIGDDGTTFAVHSASAAGIELCLFDARGDNELRRLPMQRNEDGVHSLTVADAPPARATASAPGEPTRRTKASGSTPQSCWSIPMPTNSTAPSATIRASRSSAMTPPISCQRQSSRNRRRRRDSGAALQARRPHLRSRGAPLHHAASGHPRKPARHRRRAGASVRHRAPEAHRRHRPSN